ncbi:hypothetical protein ACWEF6_01810 [Amycolatopsis sp. NPDC004772]
MKIWDTKATFELLGKQANGNYVSLYVGPWNRVMEQRISYCGLAYHGRLIRRYVRDTEVQAMFYGHPDLKALEAHLDDFYAIPGSPYDPPNRSADPEILSALRRRVPPFDGRPESFWPEGFDPDAIEGAA